MSDLPPSETPPPVRGRFWIFAIAAALLLGVVTIFLKASPFTDDRYNIYGHSYILVLPIVILAGLMWVWNPLWQRWGFKKLVISTSEALLLTALFFMAAFATKQCDLGVMMCRFDTERTITKTSGAVLHENTRGIPLPAGVKPLDIQTDLLPASLQPEPITEEGTWPRQYALLPPQEASSKARAMQAEAVKQGLPKPILSADSDYRIQDRLLQRELTLENRVQRRLDEMNVVGAATQARLRAGVERQILAETTADLGAARWPIINNSLVIVAVLLLIFGIVAMTSRQWTHHERLQFPLNQVPLTIIKPGILRDRGFVIAMLLIFGLHIYSQLGASGVHPFPTMSLGGERPVVKLNGIHTLFGFQIPADARWIYETFWSAIYIWPAVIGVAFLLTTEVGFSLWGGFWFMAMIFGWLGVVGIQASIANHGKFMGVGSTLAMGVVVLWIGRHHYWTLVQSALGLKSSADRLGVWGLRMLVAGAVAAVVVLWHLGTGIGFSSVEMKGLLGSVILIAMLLLIFITVARLVAETGILNFEVTQHLGVLFTALGLPFLLPIQMSLLMAIIGTQFFGRAPISGFAVQSLAFVNEAKIPQRRSVPALLVILLVLGAGCLTLVFVANMLLPGQTRGPSGAVDQIVPTADIFRLRSESGPINPMDMIMGESNRANVISFVIGIALLFGIYGIRRFWVRFPFHPIGLVVALCFPIYSAWGSLFLGWLAKVLVLKYGGSGFYQRVKPVAIGLIVGDALGYFYKVACSYSQDILGLFQLSLF